MTSINMMLGIMKEKSVVCMPTEKNDCHISTFNLKVYFFLLGCKIRFLKTILKKSSLLKNNVGKVENAANQHFLLVPQCFLLDHGHITPF